jgi:periplasmic divalent cation tolerance protein
MAVLLVLCTLPDMATAENLADSLIEARLVACVNLHSGWRSIYRWQGRIEHSDETLMLIKTTTERFDALKEHIVQVHPYSLPEVLAFEATTGLDLYLRWVAAETTPIGDIT